MITTSIVWNHRGRVTKNGLGPVELRITLERKSYYLATGIKVLRRQWDYDSIVRHPAAEELNERLGLIVKAVQAKLNEYLASGRRVDIAELRQCVNGMPEGGEGEPVLEWIVEQMGALDIAYGTRRHYNTLRHRLSEWGGIVRWSDVTVENIYKLDAWLHKRRVKPTNAERASGELPALVSDAAIYNYHKCFRALLSRAERMGKIASNPYSKMRGQIKRGDRENIEYLTEDEMAAIEGLRPTEGTQMAVVRDLFVFQMYTGLAFSDMQAFDIGQYRNVGGRWRSRVERVKTGVPFVSQLLPPAVAVLEKYGMKIPKIQLTDYDKCLKALGMAAGISVPLHSHLARHTFATFMLRNGVKIENLSKMMGHTNITQTQRYAKVMAESVHEDYTMIEAVLAKKKQ